MISILFPTIRPHLFERSFDSIAPAAAGVNYEVIVVADFGPLDLPKTSWIVRERLGPIDAINVACLEATGDYLFVFNDESTLDAGALMSLYCYALANPGQVLSPYHMPDYTFTYFGKSFAAFPFVHRDVAKKLGGLFDPAYKAFYADPDLGMRAHAAGIPVHVVHAATIRHANGQDDAKLQNLGRYMAIDQATFRTRWGHLGEFHDC